MIIRPVHKAFSSGEVNSCFEGGLEGSMSYASPQKPRPGVNTIQDATGTKAIANKILFKTNCL